MADDQHAIDALYMQRAYELARQGVGNTSPNPNVGAVFVRDGAIIGEGYHRQTGLPHAEIEALRATGDDVKGATLYVSLEPCFHEGRTGSCARKLLPSGLARIVVGALDPNPETHGQGVRLLEDAGVEVRVLDDPQARTLIEIFAAAMQHPDRPAVALKMAMSLDGYVNGARGTRQQLTGSSWAEYVRRLRIMHDAVMVGAGTIRIDDPLLTVRPQHERLVPFTRVVGCETDTVPETSRVFEPVEGYGETIVLAPAGVKERFENLRGVADVVFVGDEKSMELDLTEAMRALRARGVQSVFCEGGPTLGGRLIARGLVDRLYWAIAPMLLRNENALPVLAGADLASLQKRIDVDLVELVGEDVLISGVLRNGNEKGRDV